MTMRTGKITAPARYVRSTANGNPIYRVEVDGAGYFTPRDGQVGYVVTNFKPGDDVRIEVNEKSRITWMEEVES